MLQFWLGVLAAVAVEAIVFIIYIICKGMQVIKARKAADQTKKSN